MQWRTIEGSVILWDTLRPSGRVHRHLTVRHFIVGLQRVRHPRQLKIASYQQEQAFLGEQLSNDLSNEQLAKRRRIQ